MMRQISIDLGPRYAAAFGIFASGNHPEMAFVDVHQGDYHLAAYSKIDADFERIKLTYEKTEVHFSALPFTDRRPDLDHVLAPPPLISFSRQKQHVETSVNDSDNMVIEHWGTKPWDINIKGLLIDIEKRHYPESLVKEIACLFNYKGPIEVSGKQFFDKDIASIYLQDIDISGVEGYQDTVQFAFKAKSIRSVEFNLLNP